MAKFCRYCGNKMNDDAMFCRVCGKGVASSGASQQQMSQQTFQQQPVQQTEQQYQPLVEQFQQMQYQPQKQPRVKSPGSRKRLGLVLGIVGGGIVLAGIIVGAVIMIVNSNPKKAFIKYAVDTSKNVDDELSAFGGYQVEALFHVRSDDDVSKHTLLKETEITSDNLDGKQISFAQKYAYDKSSGDTSYEVGLTMDGESAGTAGIYFSGNEFIYEPFSASEPMVRYELDEEDAKSLKEYGAVDRFAYMINGESGKTEFDWEDAQEEFEETLEDLDKSDFEKDEEDFELLGKDVTCDTITLELEGEDASEVLQAFVNMISGSSGYEEYEEKLDEYLKTGEEDSSGLQLTMTTYSYKKNAVGVSLLITNNGESSDMKLTAYVQGDEKQIELNFNDGNEDDNFVYVNSIVNTGGKECEYYTNIETGGMIITISEDGLRSGDKISLSGTFTVDMGALMEDSTISGTLSHDYDGKDGTIETIFDIDDGEKSSIASEITFDSSEADVDFPDFIAESGNDTGSDLEKLKEALGDSFEEESFKSNNPTLNNLSVFGLLIDGASFTD